MDADGREKRSDEDDDDDGLLANFLEKEILSASNQDQQHQHQEEDETTVHRTRTSKKPRLIEEKEEEEDLDADRVPFQCFLSKARKRITESGAFIRIPPELCHNIFKFLSSEDLISCSLACRFMNFAASDESLWRRLYCMRWGLASPAGKLHTCPWKKLYIQRDQEDMIEFIRNTPSEFKEYYIQMQAAKRSQAPLPSQVNDDRVILDKTVADQVSTWKSIKGLTDDFIIGHACSGNTCTYFQIGDVFLCEKTGRVHVCDDACREAVLDPSSGNLVCTISGHCFDRLLSPDEESDADQQVGATDEAEPFMGSGRFARAYLLGYSCADEKELKAALRFC